MQIFPNVVALAIMLVLTTQGYAATVVQLSGVGTTSSSSPILVGSHLGAGNSFSFNIEIDLDPNGPIEVPSTLNEGETYLDRFSGEFDFGNQTLLRISGGNVAVIDRQAAGSPDGVNIRASNSGPVGRVDATTTIAGIQARTVQTGFALDPDRFDGVSISQVTSIFEDVEDGQIEMTWIFAFDTVGDDAIVVGTVTDLNVTSIPEPSSFGLICVSVLGYLTVSRRRSRILRRSVLL